MYRTTTAIQSLDPLQLVTQLVAVKAKSYDNAAEPLKCAAVLHFGTVNLGRLVGSCPFGSQVWKPWTLISTAT
jgi:hypothetical protein